MSTIFVNLPVADLQQSIAFYKARGFSQNLDFSNESGACMVRSETIYVMVLVHDFYATFLPAHKKIADSKVTSAVLNALQVESKEAVDALFDKALGAGGKQTIPPYDHGFMYGKDFEDLDGHIWEIFWMDVTQAP